MINLMQRGQNMDYWSNTAGGRETSSTSPNERLGTETTPNFPQWDRLPRELQFMIIDLAASVEDRQVANSTVRSLRGTSKASKALVDNAPLLTKEKIEALQRNPGVVERAEAAYADYVGGRLPREACRVNGVIDEKEIDELVAWGASLAFASEPNSSAREIIERFEVSKPEDVARLRMHGAERDFNNGARALDAIKDNGMLSNMTGPGPGLPRDLLINDVNLMLLRGARRDFENGMSAPNAIRNNQEVGIYELNKFSQDQLRRQGAERDKAAGMTADEAADSNGMDNNAHREAIGARRLEPALQERPRSRSMSR